MVTCRGNYSKPLQFLRPITGQYGGLSCISQEANQAAPSVPNLPKMPRRNNFVDLREYRIRDYQKEGSIPGILNPAGSFTWK